MTSNKQRTVEPCFECMMPETTTFIVVLGSSEWQEAILTELGCEAETAKTLVEDNFHQNVIDAAAGKPIVVTADNYLVWPQVGGSTLAVTNVDAAGFLYGPSCSDNPADVRPYCAALAYSSVVTFGMRTNHISKR
jgi:hypothetical protein